MVLCAAWASRNRTRVLPTCNAPSSVATARISWWTLPTSWGIHPPGMIRTIDLGKAYGARALFEGVSLELNEGSRYGLVGANGSG